MKSEQIRNSLFKSSLLFVAALAAILGANPTTAQTGHPQEAHDPGSDESQIPRAVAPGQEEMTPELDEAVRPSRATLERMAARTLLVGFNGTKPDSPALARFHDRLGWTALGGFVLFDRNLSSRKELSRLTAFLQDGFPGEQFIAVDEEGGAVQRLARLPGVARVPSAAKMAQLGLRSAEEIYGSMARTLAELGFNLNFGPVADLAINPRNPVVARLGRSYGRQSVDVVPYADAFIRAHQHAGVFTAAKHFPGHGSSSLDPHRTSVDATRSWSPKELEPFRGLFRQNPPEFVMTSHLLLQSEVLGIHDPELATFSQPLTETLRRNLGFGGLVVTDDLTMDAIKLNYEIGAAVRNAIAAGYDLVIIANLGPYPERIISRVIEAVADTAESDPEFRVALVSAAARVDQFWEKQFRVRQRQTGSDGIPRQNTPAPTATPPDTKSKPQASNGNGAPIHDAMLRSLREIEAALEPESAQSPNFAIPEE